MKLTNAIRWACERTEPSGAEFYAKSSGVEYTCTLGAVLYTLQNLGETTVEVSSLHELLNELKNHYPCLTSIVQLSDKEAEKLNDGINQIRLHALILHLNDSLSWSRVSIARFIDELAENQKSRIGNALVLDQYERVPA